MLSLRTVSRINAVRSFANTSSSRFTPATFITGRRFAGDYGSGTQNSEPNASVAQEHPGPASPSAAQQGNATGNSKPEQAQRKQADSASGSKAASSGGGSGEKSSGGSGPKPKIYAESPPKEGDEPADVKKHNDEMKNRAEGPHKAAKEQNIKKR